MYKSKLKLKPLKTQRVKLFDLAQISEDEASTSLPIKVATKAENVVFERDKLKRKYAFNIMSYKNGESLPLPPSWVIESTYFSGANADKSLICISTPPFGSYYVDLDDSTIGWKIFNSMEATSYDAYRYRDMNRIMFATKRENRSFLWDEINGMIECDIHGGTFNYPEGVWLWHCSHYGRCFVVSDRNEYKIFFSSVGNLLDFSEKLGKGGYINLDINYGRITKLLSFNDYLYIFLERGIMRLRAYGDQRDFLLKKLDANTGLIISSSIVNCGDRVVFVSSRGVMVFDGYSVTAILREISDDLYEKIVSSTRVNAIFMENCYYLVYEDNGGSKMLIIDLSTRAYSYIDMQNYTRILRISDGRESLVAFSDAKSDTKFDCDRAIKLEIVSDDKDYYINPTGIVASAKIDMDSPDVVKNIRTIEAASESEYKLIIRGDDDVDKTFNITSGVNHINMRSKYFYFTIMLSGKKQVLKSPVVNIEYLEGHVV